MQAELIATTQDAVFVGVPMMDESEARACVTRIKTRIDIARGELLELKDREGWRALGYKNWSECARGEFGMSVATLYRQLEAAEIMRGMGDSQFENLPTTHLQAVKHLAPEQQVKALTQAHATTNGKPTAKAVQQAAAELTQPDLPIEFSVIQRRFELHGHILSEQIQGQHRVYSIKREGMTGIATFKWEDVLSKLERMDANPPPPPPTPAPVGDPLPPKLLALALSDLDATLPKQLSDAGYFWQSAIPPIIAHNDGWRGDAPTPDLALNCAWDRLKGKAAPQMIALPPFPAQDLPALMQSIAHLIKVVNAWSPDAQQRVAPALGMIKAIGRKALELSEAKV